MGLWLTALSDGENDGSPDNEGNQQAKRTGQNTRPNGYEKCTGKKYVSTTTNSVICLLRHTLRWTPQWQSIEFVSRSAGDG